MYVCVSSVFKIKLINILANNNTADIADIIHCRYISYFSLASDIKR